MAKAFDEWANDAETQRLSAKAGEVQSKILDKYNNKQASQLLKELGYEDTKRAREFVKNVFVDRFENDYFA